MWNEAGGPSKDSTPNMLDKNGLERMQIDNEKES
jgi:hypothetical protein